MADAFKCDGCDEFHEGFADRVLVDRNLTFEFCPECDEEFTAFVNEADERLASDGGSVSDAFSGTIGTVSTQPLDRFSLTFTVGGSDDDTPSFMDSEYSRNY